MTNQQPDACTVRTSTRFLVPLPLALAIVLVLLIPLNSRGDFIAQAVRAMAPIDLDGQIDSEEWIGAERLGAFVQFEPYRGDEAEVQTEVYILYDDRYVYFGFRCFDPKPSQIAAQLTQRDSDLLTDDAVLVVIDTFADRRSAYYFSTNLLGTQADGRITDNGRVVENTWDAAWRSAAARSEEGWSAEIAIPLAALRFRSGDSVEWGLNLGRTSRRLLETSFWAGPLEERYRISQYGTFSGLNLETAQRRYELIPYVLADFEEVGDSTATGGLDLRYALTPENVFNLTLNPDFAIVEADQEVINLTRFEVNLSEKRQFFLEGSEQYRQRIQTFYSRRIADIRIGSKFLGRSGRWQYSLLTAQSDPIPIQADIPMLDSANYSVVRLQRDILESSTLAFMTSNRSLGGTNQGAVGLDTTLFLSDTFGFTGQLIRAHGPIAGGRWAWFVRPSRDTATSHVHFNYTHMGDALGDNLNAIGFVQDDDRRAMDGRFTKTFWPRSSALERIAYISNYNIYWSQKNTLRSWRIDEALQVEFRNRWTARYAHQSEYKLFEKKFRNHGNEIELGYNTREFESFWVVYRSGRNFDSNLDLVRGGVRRKLSDQLSVEYEFTRLWLDPDPQPSSTTIHVIRSTQNFTKDLFLKLFFQTSSVIERQNLQIVFVWRYQPPFGTVQFAYQRGSAQFGERSDQGNTFFTKFSYVF